MQIALTVHNYAGKGEDRVSILTESSAQFAKRLIGAGYTGDAWNVADLIDAGISVFVKQFNVTVQKLQTLEEMEAQNPDGFRNPIE